MPIWKCHDADSAPTLQVAIENAKGINVPSKLPRPSVLAFSRQGMPNQPGTSMDGVAKGAYIVHGGDAKPDVIILATGRPLSPQQPPLHQLGMCNDDNSNQGPGVDVMIRLGTCTMPRWPVQSAPDGFCRHTTYFLMLMCRL